MSEREYAKNIIDIVSDEQLSDVIEYLINKTDENRDEEKFKLVSAHVLNKYRKAFEKLAK